MKYDISEAAREIKRRSAVLKEKKRQKKYTVLYSVANAALFSLIIAVMLELDVFGPAEVGDSVFGSFLLSKEAGGYVLVGLICFVIAVVVTLYCVRHAEKKKNKTVDDDPADNI